MAQSHPVIGDTQKAHAEQRDDQKLVRGRDGGCPRCGHDEAIITYYDALAPDRQCTNCGHVW